MILHKNKELFTESIRAASQYHSLRVEYIEKDYWITEILFQLSESSFANNTIFKGGTSLSKGYNLIERFSEDIDLAVFIEGKSNGSKIKNLIREIEKEITKSLEEITIDTITSKGSKYRKSVFEFRSIEVMNNSNRVIVEISNFSEKSQTETRKIDSFVHKFLKNYGHDSIIELYNLHPISVSLLSKEFTLIEKLVSLFRFSFDDAIVESLSSKIRHFYDLHFLLQDQKCIEYINSEQCKYHFKTTFSNDQKMFDIPIEWKNKKIKDSPLINNFPSIWNEMKGKYVRELSSLSYGKIPDESEIEKSFLHLLKSVVL